MDMRRINSGRLRAAGYEPRERVLRIEFTDGRTMEYLAVGDEVWRRLSSSSAAWSYFRDNIEDEFASRRVSAPDVQSKSNPLDDLFRK